MRENYTRSLSQSGLTTPECEFWQSDTRKAKTHIKRLVLLVAFLLLSTAHMLAQSPSTYEFSSTATTYTAITDGTNYPSVATTTLDDNVYTNLPIGFSFTYNSTVYTAFGINANGWITFGTGTPSSSYVPISGGSTNNVASAFGVDLIARQTVTGNRTTGSPTLTVTSGTTDNIVAGATITGTGIPTGTTVLSKTAATITLSANATTTGTGATITICNPSSGIRYSTLGTAPNRKLVVQFSDFVRYNFSSSYGEVLNFQIVLNETTNSIDYIYNLTPPTSTTASTLQIGLRGASSAVYNTRTATTSWASTTAGTANSSTVAYSNTVYPAAGLKYTFAPPAGAYLTAGTLTAFSNTCINTDSATNNFTLSGGNLTSAVTVGALTGFSYSTTTGGTYTNTLTLTPASGSLSQTVYVKFSPTAVQSYNGNIPVTGAGTTGATNVAASGAGVNSTPTVSTNGTAGSTTLNSATISASNISSIGCSAIINYGIEYSTTSGFTTGTGTQVLGTGYTTGTFSTNLSGLAPNTIYYYRAFARNSAGIAYTSSQSSFSTEYLSPVTWSEGFTTTGFPAGWASSSTSWYVGTTVTGNPGNALYKEVYSTGTGGSFTTLNVGPIGANDRLKFDWRNHNYYSTTTAPGTTAGTITIEATTNLGATWSTIASFPTSAVATWQTTPYYSLTAYSGQNVKLRFTVTYTSTNYADFYIAFDNFLIEPTPTCEIPTGITLSAITHNSVNATWTAPTVGIPSEYQYEVRTSGAAGSGSTGLVTTGTVTAPALTAAIAGLTQGTAYNIYMRTHCTGSDYSNWTAATAFTTEYLSPVTWSEGFTTTSAPGWLATSGWYLGTTVPGNPGNSIYRQVYSAASSGYFMTTNVGPIGTNDRLKFDWRNFNTYTNTNAPGTGAATITVEVSTNYGNTWTSLTSFTTSAVTTWQTSAFYSLSAYSGQIVKLRYTITYTSTSSADFYIGFDNFLIEPTPACDVPSAITTSAITTNSATLNWSVPAAGTPTAYEYEVRTGGAAGSGSTGLVTSGSVAAPVTTANISSLTPGTTYYIYARTLCGTNYSIWSPVTAFTTVCVAITTLPWTENFDTMQAIGTNVLPNCWTASSATLFSSANAASNTYNDPRSNPNYLTTAWHTGAQYVWTPGFELSAGVSYDFSFYWAGDTYSGWTGEVYVNGSASSTGATQLGAAYVSSGTTTTASYTLVKRTFTPTANGTYYFGVSSGANYVPYYLGYDDFSLVKAPSSITSFTPSTTCSEGGQTVTITGLNLTDASAVTFNGVNAASYNVVSSTSITAVTPAGVMAGNIVVTTPLNTATSTTSMSVLATPVVADITGNSGALCSNGTVALASATPDGVWTSSNAAIASVNAASGLVTGHGAGAVTITYTLSNGSCYASKTTSINVYDVVAITSVTSTQAVTPGATATYTVSATGSGLTYQWEVNNGSGWSALTGATSATLTITNATLAMNGYEYRAVVSGTAPCASAISSPASTLYVSQVGISANPQNVSNCSSTTTATFGITATGSNITYLWQQSTDGGTNWVTVTDGTSAGITYAGTTTATLSLSGLVLANSGYQYRAVVSDTASNTAASTEAILTITEAVNVTTQPAAQNACTGVGATKTFTVAYTGSATIQWQYSANGTTWANVANAAPAGVTYTGATTGSLGVTTTSATAAGTYYYRASFTGTAPCGVTTSNTTTLTVGTPTVTVTPNSANYCSPGTGLTLTASGALTYTWSPSTGLSATTGASVVASPTATTTYTVTGTDANGCIATATTTVTVNSVPAVTATAALTTVCPGSTVQLDVTNASSYTTPAPSAYQFAATTGTYTEVGSGATQLTSVQVDSGISTAQSIGFTFNYGNVDYTQFKMSSNGFISLNTSGTATLGTNDFSSANASSRPVIAPLWDDLDGNATGGSYAGYEVTGTAPNRVLTVEWRNWEWNYNSSNPVISFQVKLYEGSNNIEFVYRSETGSVVSGSASIGIGAATGSGSNSYLNLTSVTTPAVSSTSSVTTISTKPATGTVYRFSPGAPPTFTYVWTSVPAGFTSNIKNPVATVNANTQYTVTVTANSGCAGTSGVSVNKVTGGTITTQPVGATLCQGANHTLTVTATGVGLTYQWRKGGINISGATSNTYAITSALPAATGSYDVVVTPGCGSAVTSDAATVTVNPTPTATAPANVAQCFGTQITAITLTGTPTGVTFDVTGGSAIGLANLTNVTAIPAFTPTATGAVTLTLTPKANGCTGTAVTFTITVNPAPTAITITPSTATICNGTTTTLTATGGHVSSVLFSENFNGTVTGWTTTTSGSNSTGAWAYQTAPYTYSYLLTAFTTTNGGKFAMANSDVGGSGSTTNTILTSPSFSTVGLSAATLTFEHYYRYNTSGDSGQVQISTNGGTSWSTLETYTSTQGSTNATSAVSINLTSYLNQADVRIRFNFVSAWGYFWIMDNFVITGTSPSVTWSPVTDLYTDANATLAYTGDARSIIYAKPTTTTTYTAAATSTSGCSISATAAITVTTTAAPTASAQDFCNGATIANLTATGSNIQWYVANTGGAALAGTTALATGTYYASQTVNGCESTRTAVVVTISKMWNGNTDTNWANATNWCGNTVPTAADNVIIAVTGNNPVINSDTGFAHNLTVQTGATLTVATGANLSVDSNVNVNSGGTLTVQDNGALLQSAIATANNNSGSIIFHKKSNPLYRLDYTMWGAPVAGQNLLAFSPTTTANRFYMYLPEESAYQPLIPSTTDFALGKGYLIRMPSAIATLLGYAEGTASTQYNGTFTGVPNNGTVAVTLSSNGDRYNAVGNPYPSPINIAAFYAGNVGTLDESTGIYLWRKRNNGDNPSYATITQAAYVANTAEGGGAEQSVFFNGNYNNWTLAPGQGFIVRTVQGTTNPVMQFTNAMRTPTPGTTQAFLRQAGAGAPSRLWLNLTSESGTASQAAIAYMEQGTLGLDYGFDGRKLNNASTIGVYSIAENTALAIQARPEFNATDVVPMGYNAPAAGTYTISLERTEGVFEQGQVIYIRDNAEGIIRSLTDHDYTFTSEAGTIEGRFDVLYQNVTLGTDNPVIDESTVVVFKQGNTIKVHTGSTLMNGVTIYDIRGRKVYSQDNINSTQTAISNLTAEQQVLIVEVNTVKGKVSKRIVF